MKNINANFFEIECGTSLRTRWSYTLPHSEFGWEDCKTTVGNIPVSLYVPFTPNYRQNLKTVLKNMQPNWFLSPVLRLIFYKINI